MAQDDLRARLDVLEARIRLLEARTDPSAEVPGSSGAEARAHGEAELSGAKVSYYGTGSWDATPVAWQMDHSWDAVRSHAGERTARVLGALGNGLRLSIVTALLEGPCTTAELGERLEQPSSGQLFHHLRELLAAGVIHQPVRGTYAVRRQDVVPLFALLAAAIDVAGPDGEGEPQ